MIPSAFETFCHHLGISDPQQVVSIVAQLNKPTSLVKDPFTDPFADPFSDPFGDPFGEFSYEFFDPHGPEIIDGVLTLEEFTDPAINEFQEGLSATLGNDNLLGGDGNTQFTMTQGFSLGGTDVVDGGLGTDEITLSNLSDFQGIFDLDNQIISYSTSDGLIQGALQLDSVEQLYADDGVEARVRLSFSDTDTGFGYIVAGGTGADTISTAGSGNSATDLTYGDLNHDIDAASNIVGSILFGGAGKDAITGSDGDDIIYGGDGDDIINATAGGGVVNGGAGSDTLTYAGVGTSRTFSVSSSGLSATESSDLDDISNVEKIVGSDNGDIFSFSGDSSSLAVETISGGSGNDTFSFNSGATITSTLQGGSGSDVFQIGSGVYIATTLDAGAGTDVLSLTDTSVSLNTIGFEAARLQGTAGDDTLSLTTASVGGLSISSVIGGNGTDTLNISAGANVSNLIVDAVETISDSDGSDSIVLADGGQTITTSGIETITGGGGNDTITLGAAQGSGTIDGGSGSDQITFANGTNSVLLQNMETIIGGTGTEILTLGSGVDNTVTATNVETISGGDGNDTINLGDADDIARISGGGGNDTVNLANGSNSVDFFGVETIAGGTGADVITSQDSTAEIITGGNGSDTITGSGGNDRITGGTGADHFVFSGQRPENLGTDNLIDYSGATNFGGSVGEGDKIILDTSNLSISGISFDDVTFSSGSYSTGFAAAGASVITIGGEATTITNAISELIFAGFNASNAVVLFHDSDNANTLSMYYTEDLDGSSGTTTSLATFDSINTVSQVDILVAADFAVQAGALMNIRIPKLLNAD